MKKDFIVSPLKRWFNPNVLDEECLPTSELSTQLLVLQSTPFCNINCDYCYLPNRSNRDKMTMATLNKTIDHLIGDKLLADELVIVWHAGEPLTLPLSYYRKAFELVQRRLGAICKVTHSIQTNGMLIDEYWCQLFNEFNVQLGLSIDGPAQFHDAHRKTRKGKGTHATVMQAVKLLKKHDVVFSGIAVVTADSIRDPDTFLEHFRNIGVVELGINFDEPEGVNTESSLYGLENEHIQFMSRIHKKTLVRESEQWPRIREFNNAYSVISYGLPMITLGKSSLPITNLNIPYRLISVACSGDFSTFSPELIGQRAPDWNNFVIGNVNSQSFLDARRNDTFRQLWASIKRGISLCQSECQYFKYCGGGAPANKFYENGTFASTETLYCRTMIQHPFNIALEHMESSLLTRDQKIPKPTMDA